MQHHDSQLSTTVAKIMADKRAAKRVRATFSASLHSDGMFFAHCVIVDVSITGMKLRLQEEIELPERLEIRTPAMPETLKVELAWANGREFGVRYVPVQSEEPVDIAS